MSDTPNIPQCRTLYSAETGWSDDAPEHLKQRPLVVRYKEPVAPRVQWVYAKNAAPPRQQAVERVKYAGAPRPVGRPATRPTRTPKPIGTSGVRNPAINITRILDLQKQGLSNTAIAREIGCHLSAISKHLLKHRRSSEDAAALLTANRQCACKRRKAANVDMCGRCKQNARRREQRLARRGKETRG